MRRLAYLIVCLMPIAGCGGSSSTTQTTTASLDGNWQIESGTAIGPNTGGVSIGGALNFASGQVTGTLTVSAPCVAAGPQTFAGVIDGSGNLTLDASPLPDIEVQLAIPSNATQLATGTIASAGEICSVASSGASVGGQITTLSGKYSGTGTSGTTTGTVTLAVTQSTSANSSGQFPLTGTLTYTSGSCTEDVPVTGAIAGINMTLASTTIPVTGQNYVSFTGTTNQAATTLTASAILFEPGPCSASASSTATYTGTLTQ